MAVEHLAAPADHDRQRPRLGARRGRRSPARRARRPRGARPRGDPPRQHRRARRHLDQRPSPAAAAASRPPGPSTTSSTAATLGSDVIATSASATASAGVARDRRAERRQRDRRPGRRRRRRARPRRAAGPSAAPSSRRRRARRASRRVSGAARRARCRTRRAAPAAGPRWRGRPRSRSRPDAVRREPNLERLMMRAHRVVGDVLERQVESRAGGARTSRPTAGATCHPRRRGQGSRSGGCAGSPSRARPRPRGRRARPCRRPRPLHRARREPAPSRSPPRGSQYALDQRREVVGEPARERVLDHRRCSGDAERRVDLAAALAERLLDDRGELADAGDGHGAQLSFGRREARGTARTPAGAPGSG